MRKLLLMRHAKSGWENPALADHDRTLNERGRISAPRMGEWMLENGHLPDLIVTSTAVRTRQTTDLLIGAVGYQGPVDLQPDLYLATFETWQKVLAGLPDSARTVLCVGHNPGLEDVLTHVAGQPVEMKTASIAVLSLSVDSWHEWSRMGPHSILDFTIVRARDVVAENDVD